ncbi:MAG: hypothetical protein B6D58_06425 [candidate division Zixibacteria bacterium 4484_95]|nr:MAG: hypothetical protein B6D58_06425 [candidate division Zixibacteria bacterium 4484_95]
MMKHCRRCGKTTEIEAGMKFCPNCGAPYEDTQSHPDDKGETPGMAGLPQGKTAESEQQRYTPWEDKGKLGFLGSLFETWKKSVFEPTDFYRKMPVKGGIGNPLLYGLILAFIGFVFQMVYRQLFTQLFDPSHWYPYFNDMFDRDFNAFEYQLKSISMLAGIMIFPFMAAAWFFIWSGITHLILTIFGWKKEEYEASFRLIAYSEGPSFFLIVPLIGGLISIVWQLVLVVIGIKEVHRVSAGQALLVVFLPTILCCLCCCSFVWWIIGLAGISN